MGQSSAQGQGQASGAAANNNFTQSAFEAGATGPVGDSGTTKMIPQDDTTAEEKTGDDMSICNDLVYKLVGSNTTDDPIQYKISFEALEGESVNLVLPINGLKGKLKPGETSIIALLQKIEPTSGSQEFLQKAELDKLDFTLKVKIDVDNDKTSSLKQRPKSPKNVSFNQTAISAPASLVKNCGACTMENPMHATQCSICMTPFN